MDVRKHDGGRYVVVGSRSDFLDRSVVDPPAHGGTLMPGGRDPNAPPINPILRWLLIVTMLVIVWLVFGPRLLDYLGL